MSLNTFVGLGSILVSTVFLGTNYVPVKKYKTFDGILFQWYQSSGTVVVGLILAIIIDWHWKSGLEVAWEGLIGGLIYSVCVALFPLVCKLSGLAIGFVSWTGSTIVMGWAVGRFGLWDLHSQAAKMPILDIVGVSLCFIAIVGMLFVKPDNKTIATLETKSNYAIAKRNRKLIHQQVKARAKAQARANARRVVAKGSASADVLARPHAIDIGFESTITTTSNTVTNNMNNANNTNNSNNIQVSSSTIGNVYSNDPQQQQHYRVSMQKLSPNNGSGSGHSTGHGSGNVTPRFAKNGSNSSHNLPGLSGLSDLSSLGKVSPMMRSKSAQDGTNDHSIVSPMAMGTGDSGSDRGAAGMMSLDKSDRGEDYRGGEKSNNNSNDNSLQDSLLSSREDESKDDSVSGSGGSGTGSGTGSGSDDSTHKLFKKIKGNFKNSRHLKRRTRKRNSSLTDLEAFTPLGAEINNDPSTPFAFGGTFGGTFLDYNQVAYDKVRFENRTLMKDFQINWEVKSDGDLECFESSDANDTNIYNNSSVQNKIYCQLRNSPSINGGSDIGSTCSAVAEARQKMRLTKNNNAEKKSSNREFLLKFFGTTLAVLQGIIGGNTNTFYLYWSEKHSEISLNYVFAYYLGIYLGATAMFTLMGLYRKASKQSWEKPVVRPAFFSGVMYGIGYASMLLAANYLPFPVVFVACNVGAIVVSNFWSLFYFKEITESKSLRILSFAIFLMIVGIVAEGVASA